MSSSPAAPEREPTAGTGPVVTSHYGVGAGLNGGMDEHLEAHRFAAPMADAPTGPLQGVRIIDVTHAVAGPYGAMLLADLGADVIKVEGPKGDMTRKSGPFTRDDEERPYSGGFTMRNRNKRSICLDLADEADREVFLELVATADGLIENMRAGVMDRLGVGWEACRQRNPRLVYAAVRGFGDPRTSESPYVDWPAYDLIAQAMGGIVASTGADEDNVMKVGPVIGDTVSGLMAALGLVSALYRARETGQGQFLDVAMVDTMMSLSETSQMMYTYMGRYLRPMGTAVDGSSPYNIYPTADGQCVIATPTSHHWRLLCKLIGREDLITDERTTNNHARLRHRDVVDGAIEAWTTARTTAEVVEALGGQVPVGPVYRPADWVHDPHVAAREMLVRVDHDHHRPTVVLNCPIKLTDTPAGIYRGVPRLDEHGAEIRAQLEGEA
jgi:crotonobetainyl-CoA:carnitine CoA-transferase CaiB-like acyl-CoA transferase